MTQKDFFNNLKADIEVKQKKSEAEAFLRLSPLAKQQAQVIIIDHVIRSYAEDLATFGYTTTPGSRTSNLLLNVMFVKSNIALYFEFPIVGDDKEIYLRAKIFNQGDLKDTLMWHIGGYQAVETHIEEFVQKAVMRFVELYPTFFFTM